MRELKADGAMRALGVLPRHRRSSARRAAASDRGFAERFAARARGGAHGARAAQPATHRAARHVRLGGRGDGRRGHRRRLDGVLDARPAADCRSPRRARQCRARGAGQAARGVAADYLIAHQEYSPTTEIQGGGPYCGPWRGARLAARRSPCLKRADPMKPRVAGGRRAAAGLLAAGLVAGRGCWPRRLAHAEEPQRSGSTRVTQAARIAQLHRHGGLPARHAGRNVPPRPPERERPGIGKAPEPRRPRAGDRAHRTARSATTFPTPRSCASSRARFATCSRRCRPSRPSNLSHYYEFQADRRAGASPDATQSMGVRAQGRLRYGHQVLGRPETGSASEGAPRQRARTKSSSSSRSPTSRSARRSTRTW